MENELKDIEKRAKNARMLSVAFLGAAFLIMGGWGYTPLKNVLPALTVLILFGAFAIIAVALTILALYRDIQTKALKAKIADK